MKDSMHYYLKITIHKLIKDLSAGSGEHGKLCGANGMVAMFWFVDQTRSHGGSIALRRYPSGDVIGFHWWPMGQLKSNRCNDPQINMNVINSYLLRDSWT